MSMTVAAGVAIAGAVIAGISVLAQGISSLFGNNNEREALELQRQQLALQREQYYDDLTSSYYSYMSQIEDMRASQESSQLAINQGYEDIASNEYYLTRWGDEYESAMTTSIDESFSTYSEMASALGSTNNAASDTGRAGGTAGLISRIQQASRNQLTGGVAGFNLQNSMLGSYLNSTAQDLLSERQTARSAIATGYQSIDTYRQTIANLSQSISSLNNTTSEIKTKLAGVGRTV